MNALMFVKFAHKDARVRSDVVFLVTVPRDVPEKQDQAAEIAGRLLIAAEYHGQYKLDRVEVVCETADDVTRFEPC